MGNLVVIKGKIVNRFDYSYESKHELWGKPEDDHLLTLGGHKIYTSKTFAERYNVPFEGIKLMKDEEAIMIIGDFQHDFGVERAILIAFKKRSGKYVLCIVKELYPENW